MDVFFVSSTLKRRVCNGNSVDFENNDVSMSVEKSGTVTLTGQPLPDKRHGDGEMISNE